MCRIVVLTLNLLFLHGVFRALRDKARWHSGTAQFSVHNGQVGEFLSHFKTSLDASSAFDAK